MMGWGFRSPPAACMVVFATSGAVFGSGCVGGACGDTGTSFMRAAG